MYGSSPSSTRPDSSHGPAVYFGYCGRSGRYRMMDLPEYMSSMQDGMSRLLNDTATMYQDMLRNYSDRAPGTYGRPRRDGNCECRGHQGDDCHCQCCVCDADVLVYARCGEERRIPITFENDTRREKPVKLELGKFVTAGGRDLEWLAALSATELTLRPCGEQTVTLTVAVRCLLTPPPNQQPEPQVGAATETGSRARIGSVDRCEVGYATIRAEGCLTRPVVVAVAVLPDDCDAFRNPCGCGCCH